MSCHALFLLAEFLDKNQNLKHYEDQNDQFLNVCKLDLNLGRFDYSYGLSLKTDF
jgi:hypothetical protein